MKKKASAKKRSKQFVLITGLSGSGKGSVLKAFEDLGYHCVDNLPFDLILKFAEMCQQPGSRIDRAAAVVDIRGGEALEPASHALSRPRSATSFCARRWSSWKLRTRR